MAGFTKLFNSILDSTIWQEPNETRLLWITMLAMSDARGEVQASIPGLARRAGITIPECEAGLSVLDSPDRFSRSKEHEGRRIAAIDGGWELLNHSKYRALLSADERREYNRKKQADFRAKKKDSVNDMSITVNHNKQCQHISEAEDRSRSQIAEAEIKKNRSKSTFEIPTREMVVEYSETLIPKFEDVDNFLDYYQGNGWKIGNAKMKCWKSTVRRWNRKGKQSNGFKQPNQPKTYSGHHETIEIPDLMNPCLLIPDL